MLKLAGRVRAVPGQRGEAPRRARQGRLGRGESARGTGALSEHARQTATEPGEDSAGNGQGPERGRPPPGETR